MGAVVELKRGVELPETAHGSYERLADNVEKLAKNFAGHEGECVQWRRRVEDTLKRMDETLLSLNLRMGGLERDGTAMRLGEYRSIIILLFGVCTAVVGALVAHFAWHV